MLDSRYPAEAWAAEYAAAHPPATQPHTTPTRSLAPCGIKDNAPTRPCSLTVGNSAAPALAAARAAAAGALVDGVARGKHEGEERLEATREQQLRAGAADGLEETLRVGVRVKTERKRVCVRT